MRILCVAQTYYPYLAAGGRPIKVRAIAEGLAARGHRVTVLTADFGPERVSLGTTDLHQHRSRLGWRGSEHGVDVVYLRTAFEHRWVTLNPTLLRFCRTELRDVDVVHIFGIYDLMGAVVAAYCRRYGIPYVVEPIGMHRPISRSLFAKRIYHALLGQPLDRGAAHLIATSEQERAELLDAGVPEHKIVVRRNGVAGPSARPRRGDFRTRFGIAGDEWLVLFLGRLVAKKSPDLLLRAFAAAMRAAPNRRWRLAFVGPDEADGFGARLEGLARELDVEGAVTFTGAIYGDERWSAYADADVFVLPSFNENFGNTVAESMACGTPVIVTDQCGVAEWVTDGETRAGLVVPHEERALADALVRLATDQVLYERARRGAAVLAERLGWSEPVAQLELVYESLVPEARALAAR